MLPRCASHDIIAMLRRWYRRRECIRTWHTAAEQRHRSAWTECERCSDRIVLPGCDAERQARREPTTLYGVAVTCGACGLRSVVKTEAMGLGVRCSACKAPLEVTR